jgi:tetratricopeptide (TPR) repeat protein
VRNRRAMRGLAAAKRQQGDMKGAIADLKEVLDLSQRIRDYVGDTDALGSIADMYTELGDLEQAGKYYDMYLLQLKADEDMEVV